MGDIDIEFNVHRIERIKPAIEKGIERGLEDSGSYLTGKGAEKAEDVVTGHRKVWTEEVKKGFVDFEKQKGPESWEGYVRNLSNHADVVDRGLAPAGEITGSNPSVQDIMPWVVAHLSPADYDGGGDGMDFSDDDNGGGGNTPGAITDPDFTVSNYRRTEDLGIPSSEFESDQARAATLGDGTNVVFKSHHQEEFDQDFKLGVVRNEVVWSKTQEKLDYDLGPKSRLDSHEFGNVELTGTIQEFVANSEELQEFIGSSYSSNEPFEPTDFADNNSEWIGRVNAIDYIIGNGDRHSANIRIDENDNPRGIDNGGVEFQSTLQQRKLQLFTELRSYDQVDDVDALHEANLNALDETERVLDEILQSEEFRQELIDLVEEVHGKDSQWYDRAVNLFGEDIGLDHALFKGEGDTPKYKLHMEDTRQKFEDIYNAVISPDDMRDSSTHEDEKDVDKDYTQIMNDALNELDPDTNLDDL